MKRLIVIIILLLFCFSLATEQDIITGKSQPKRVHLAMHPPQLLLKVNFSEPSGNGVLDAQERGEILISVKNVGKGAARDLAVSLIPEQTSRSLSFKDRLTIGKIEPGQTASLSAAIAADVNVPDQENRIRIEVREPHFKAHPAPVSLSFQTRRLLSPRLILSEMGIDDSQNSIELPTTDNGKIDRNEQVLVTTYLQNSGPGAAEKVTVHIKLDQANVIPLSSLQFYFDRITVNESKALTLRLFVNSEFADNAVVLKFTMTERLGRYGTTKEFRLPINQTLIATRDIKIPAKPRDPVESPPEEELSSDVDLQIPLGKITRDKAIAIVIGNKDYERSDVPEVSYAIADARAIKRYLVRTLGFKEENIIYKANLTKGGFESIFGNDQDYRGELYSSMMFMQNPEELFIYYSGHGHSAQVERDGRVENRGYFVPKECNPNTITLSGYSLDVFAKNLKQLLNTFQVNHAMVVMDACFSGYLTRQASPPGFKINNPLVAINNVSYFTSSSKAEKSYWYPEKKHGLFTYFFLKGLQNQGGAVSSSSQLTIGALGNFISENVRRYARGLHSQDQTPQIRVSREDLVLVRY